MKVWQIWAEGYVVTGNSSEATFIGEAEGETFAQACLAWFDANPSKYFDPDRLTDWGCRLFDNEADARKSFG